jgi:hypothetical protein
MASLATPVTTLGSPKVLSSAPLNAQDAKFIELNEIKYRASNGAEVLFELFCILGVPLVLMSLYSDAGKVPTARHGLKESLRTVPFA